MFTTTLYSDTLGKCLKTISRGFTQAMRGKLGSQIGKILIRSHLDYCDIIYHIPPVQTQLGVTITDLMGKAERIQYQAALAITGAWQGASRSKLYDELGWESLSERRWCRRILQIHKIVNNNTPSYLKHKLPRYRRPLSLIQST